MSYARTQHMARTKQVSRAKYNDYLKNRTLRISRGELVRPLPQPQEHNYNYNLQPAQLDAQPQLQPQPVQSQPLPVIPVAAAAGAEVAAYDDADGDYEYSLDELCCVCRKEEFANLEGSEHTCRACDYLCDDEECSHRKCEKCNCYKPY
jgi:hypothetical protein